MSWRKKCERLALHCTAPARKEGTVGRVAKFMVAMAYKKGITLCTEYRGHICGKLFADMIKRQFPAFFKRSLTGQKHMFFLQDGDPSQNSAVAYEALNSIGASIIAIPARSPDLNPIENIFHRVKQNLRKEAIVKKKTNESYDSFVRRITSAFEKCHPMS